MENKKRINDSVGPQECMGKECGGVWTVRSSFLSWIETFARSNAEGGEMDMAGWFSPLQQPN